MTDNIFLINICMCVHACVRVCVYMLAKEIKKYNITNKTHSFVRVVFEICQVVFECIKELTLKKVIIPRII